MSFVPRADLERENASLRGLLAKADSSLSRTQRKLSRVITAGTVLGVVIAVMAALAGYLLR